MGEIVTKGVKESDTTEKVSLYLPHGESALNESANLLRSFGKWHIL
jgi:hypothetical protein